MNQLYRLHRKQRQLERVTSALTSARTVALTWKQRYTVFRRIRRLQRQLLEWTPEFRLSKLFAASLVALGLLCGVASRAQTFGGAQVNPWGIVSPGYVANPTIADLDGDGDMDMLSGAYSPQRVAYYQNTGGDCMTPAAPAFNPFGITMPGGYYAFVELANMDGDADLDLWMGTSIYGAIHYYENTGTGTSPQFAAPQSNPFGIGSITTNLVTPAAVDLDGDSDLDLMVGDVSGNFLYFQNTGTASSPAFAAPSVNPFSITAMTGSFANPRFVDMNNDGDFDLVSGSYSGDIYYYSNIGNASLPSFAAPQTNPFQLTGTGGLAWLDFADLDGDTDPDGLVGTFFGNFIYFENLVFTNNPPTGGNSTVFGEEDSVLTFQLSDFPFNDPDGNPFNRIRITELESDGDLEFSGTDVTLNQDISPAQVHLLTFTPDPGEFGIGYDNFKFKVGDCKDLSPEYTMAINISEHVGVGSLASPSVGIYPNPATHAITLTSDRPIGSGIIVDATGRIVYVFESSLQHHTVDVSQWAAGLYRVTLWQGTGTQAPAFSLSR